MDRFTKAIQNAGSSRPGAEPKAGIVSGYSKENYIAVPNNILLKNKVITGIGTNHPAADYYRLLRSKILRTMMANNWRVIGITGPSPSSGKTLTAANLALSIATVPDHSVLLVDADLKKNALSKMFGISPKLGFEDILSGKAVMEETVICPGISHLGLILSNHHDAASDLLMGKALPEMIEHIKSGDDSMLTIFDLPPTYVGDEAVAIASNIDAVLLVVDSGNTTKEQLQSSMNLLKGINILGYVLNNAPEDECNLRQYGAY